MKEEIEEIDKVLKYNKVYIDSLEKRKAKLQEKLDKEKQKTDAIERLDSEEKKEETTEEIQEDEKEESSSNEKETPEEEEVDPQVWKREQLKSITEKNNVGFASRQRIRTLDNINMAKKREMIRSKKINKANLKSKLVIIKEATPVTIKNEQVSQLLNESSPKKEPVEQVFDESLLDSLVPTVKAATM